jgi:GNAT superfamily N-acetyltransferase
LTGPVVPGQVRPTQDPTLEPSASGHTNTGLGPGSDVVLGDGTSARVRVIGPDDGDALRSFHTRLSPESIVLRFFGPHPRLSDAEVERFTHVDGLDRVALVAEREAEVAFVVNDAFQGQGLGTFLLRELAHTARRHGIRWLIADTLSENFRMLNIFRHAGYARKFTRTSEVMRVVMDLTAPEAPSGGGGKPS